MRLLYNSLKSAELALLNAPQALSPPEGFTWATFTSPQPKTNVGDWDTPKEGREEVLKRLGVTPTEKQIVLPPKIIGGDDLQPTRPVTLGCDLGKLSHVPRKARTQAKPTINSHGPSLIGKVTIGIAAVGAILGGMVGFGVPPFEGPPLTPPAATTEAQPLTAETRAIIDQINSVKELLKTLPVSEGTLRESIRSVTVSGTLGSEQSLGVSDRSQLKIPSNTRLSVTISEDGLYLSFSNKLQWIKQRGFDAELSSLRYDFSDGKFQIRAEGLGPDEWYTDGFSSTANVMLKPLLPPAMRQQDYNPFRDAYLAENIGRILQLFSSSTSSANIAGLNEAVSSFSISTTFNINNEQQIPLADGTKRLTIAPGTSFTLSASTSGSLEDPKLEQIHLGVRRGEVTIANINKDGETSTFRSLDLNSISIGQGARVTANYELAPEQMADGFKALVALLAMVAEPGRPIPHMEETRLEDTRREVDAQINAEIQPKIIELLREHDGAIEGLSLLDIFGIEQR